MQKIKNEGCCSPINGAVGCCRVESVASVDERGQMVLPKDLRERAKIRAGDKLAVVSWEKDGQVCCIFLVKAEEMAAMAKNLLGPMVKEIVQ